MNDVSDVGGLTRLRASFLSGGGRCGALIAERDWSETSLGPIGGWPQSLRTIVGFLLRSPVPLVLLWGEDGVMIYNDAYSVFAGGRHPQLLGSKVREGWPEVADFNDNVMKVGLSGGTLQYRDQELTLYRHGRPEQVWMNLDYSPVPDESGEPAGVLAVVVETTQRVGTENALREREERLSFFDQLATATRALSDPFEIMAVTARQLGEHLAVSVCAYADMEPDEDGFTIRGDWAASGSKSIVGRYSLNDFGPTAVRELHAGRAFVTHDTMAELGPVEGAALLGLGLGATVCMPLVKEGRLTALMAVHQAVPRNWSEADLTLMRETTERSWAHVERVRSQAALQESEERLRLAARAAQIGTWDLDLQTGVGRWDDLAVRIGGTAESGAEYTAESWVRLIHPDDRERVTAAFEESLRPGGTPYNVEFRGAVPAEDGGVRWLASHGAVLCDESGQALRATGIVRDITHEQRAEEALRESEERFRTMANSAPVAIWVNGADGGCQFVNHSYLEFFGKADEDVLGFGWTPSAHPDDEAAYVAAYLEAVRQRATFNAEARFARADGEYRWLHSTGEPRFDASGEYLGHIGISRDITERKRAEQHQRLLIDELSHRAKNLLAIVQGVARQSFRPGAKPEEMVTAFEGRLGALGAAHDILTRQRWEAAPISELIGATVAAVSPGDGRFDLQGEDLLLPPKTGVSLAMAVHELATNALKYGSLQSRRGRVVVRWSRAGDRLRFEWREQDGPPVEPPTHRGFGTKMIKRGLAAELGGKVEMEFLREGVRCTVDAPLPKVRG
jgi:PAS domain S-box-containing protein